MSLQDLEHRADDVAELLSVMSHAKRLMILCHLLEGEMSVNQLLDHVELGQSAMSQHLGKLRAMKLVATRRDAQKIYYRLASTEISKLLSVLKELYC